MISNKTAVVLLFITLNMQCDASTFRGTKRRRSPVKSTLTKRQKRPLGTRGTALMLRDATNAVRDVEVTEESNETTSISLEQPVSQPRNRFKTLIEQGEYEKIVKLGRWMNNEEFLRQLCPVIETPDQYKRVVDYLKGRRMVVSFYVNGNIEVVRTAIIESKYYYRRSYVHLGDLENALLLALEKDRHDLFIELFRIRKEVTAGMDEPAKQRGGGTSFEWFLHDFFDNLAPWGKNGMALRRFFVLLEDEQRSKHRDVFDTLCHESVIRLFGVRHTPIARQLLVDLIGQPLLITSVAFASLFLRPDSGSNKDRLIFIKYGWRETIQEGLKTEYLSGGKKLWLVMQKERPGQFLGEFPETEEARTAACMHLPTKQQKEQDWIKNNAKIVCSKIKSKSISRILPDVLWSIISEYAALLAVTWNLTTSTE